MSCRYSGRSGLWPVAVVTVVASTLVASAGEGVTDIGDRLELFVDRHLIESTNGVRLELHPPEPREIVMRTDKPWEGKGTAFFTVLKDDDRFRMYYRGSGNTTIGDRNPLGLELTCYAESQDGIEWTKPSLGLFEFEGSTDNNIIWMPPTGLAFGEKRLCQNFTVFKDTRPGVPEDERYKALAGMPPHALASADGIRFRMLSEDPVITDGSFDSQNVAFWDPLKKEYRAYFRIPVNRRFVATSSSDDFLNWSETTPIDAGDTPKEHLYTNATRPYFRAPHIYFAFPKRFLPGRHSAEAIFLTSRDGLRFDRTFMEALIRPGRNQRNWGDKSNMPAWGLVQTAPDEMSLYYSQNYWHPTHHLRRGVFRLDGIASASAGYDGGELVTKPVKFSGPKLVLNYATAASGSVRVELQDETGKAYEGFALSDARELYGDDIAKAYRWKGGNDVSSLAGKPVRLRFVLKDADLYSYRFGEEPPLLLADKGSTDYTIVVAKDASDSDKHGAKELQMFLEEISGARFPMITDAEAPGGPLILVGQSKKLEEVETKEGLEKIDFESLGEEGFVIRTAPPHLILAGGRPRGTLYAAYTFLEEQLDCRWFAPNVSRIPKRERIEVGALSERYIPRLEYRNVAGDPDWSTRNKLNAYFIRTDGIMYWGVHTFHRLLPPEQYFEEHPEYYSLIGGERRNNAQLCLTNPEIVPIVAENIKKEIREHPNARIFSVSQMDGFGGACECPDCKALDEKEGSQSATLIQFVNRVADVVGEEYPDVAIGTLAYLYTKKPPKTIRPRPNVVVRLGTIQKCLSHSAATCDFQNTAIFRDNITGWAKLTDRLYVWDYAICFHHYLLPFPNLDAHQPTIKYFADNSVRGVFYQTRMTGELKLLRRYILAKCMWNPDVDVRKVREEFLEGFYGPAGAPIGEYVDMIHKRVADKDIHLFIWAQPTDAYLTPEILSRARELFDEAERRVEGNAELTRRVELARLAIQYVELSRPSPFVDSAPIFEKFKAIVEREKISDYGETGKPMAGWLAEKEALFGRLPENVVYDLYRNVGTAKAENCHMFEMKAVKKNDRMVPAILQHPPNEGLGNATYEIPLPEVENDERLVLRYGTGFREPTANGVQFTILVDGTEVWTQKQKELEPVDHQLDLSEWGGRTIPLTLRVDALGNAAYDWACWVRPQVEIVADETSE